MITNNPTEYAPEVTTQELCERASSRYYDMSKGSNEHRELYAEAIVSAVCSLDSSACDGFRAARVNMSNQDLVAALYNQIVSPVIKGNNDNDLANIIARTYAVAVMETSKNI